MCVLYLNKIVRSNLKLAELKAFDGCVCVKCIYYLDYFIVIGKLCSLAGRNSIFKSADMVVHNFLKQFSETSILKAFYVYL